MEQNEEMKRYHLEEQKLSDEVEASKHITFADLLRQITVIGKQKFDFDVVEAIEANLMIHTFIIVR
jgi:hypothetical protein